MLTNNDMDKIKKDLGREDSAQHYVNTLKPYEEYMHKPEKGTFNRFEAWEKENPKKTLQNFMQESRVESIKACKESQLKTFEQINEVAKTINPEVRENLAKLTENYAKLPTETEEAMKNVRKSVIADIKDSKIKVQASIQGDQVRVSGKSRDDLQEVIGLLRKNEEKYDYPLQFQNYR